ncbi:OLC1v1031876C1 [Oldenlandia corymbosa var. corymbosa]|uniref:OLC1v1031876C1 n=1 Tax=Oldenlandia corymbosa var. corymbosa TaxID=529605 RepID=A0AAV1CLJ9_OLDCO|nr:OLC1v1031876C1 [Oldenlandia corymbosa var. corymbosa]
MVFQVQSQVWALFCLLTTAFAGTFDPDFQDVDPKQPEVVRVGKSAVGQYNMDQKADLKFETLVKAQYKKSPFFEHFWILEIQAQNAAGETHRYEAKLYSPLRQYEAEVTSFTQID